MEEIWKDVKGYEGLYQISNLGNIKSNTNIKSKRINKQGYLTTQLCKNNKKRSKRINRLVAEAFIPNPNNFPQVNHKDENKLNNEVSNLEWCTEKYNTNYGTRNLKISKSKYKKVLQFDMNMNFIKKWDSIKEAQEELKLFHISDVCKKRYRYRSCGGYIWKYEN